MNFQSATLGSEIFLNETCRDVTCVFPPRPLSLDRPPDRSDLRPADWKRAVAPSETKADSFPDLLSARARRQQRYLHSSSFFAVAQKKHVFIYDQDGTELQYVSLSCASLLSS